MMEWKRRGAAHSEAKAGSRQQGLATSEAMMPCPHHKFRATLTINTIQILGLHLRLANALEKSKGWPHGEQVFQNSARFINPEPALIIHSME